MTTYCSLTGKKHLIEKQYRTDDEVIFAVETLLKVKMSAFIPWESKCCNTNGRTVWIAEKPISENKIHLAEFDDYIVVSL